MPISCRCLPSHRTTHPMPQRQQGEGNSRPSGILVPLQGRPRTTSGHDGKTPAFAGRHPTSVATARARKRRNSCSTSECVASPAEAVCAPRLVKTAFTPKREYYRILADPPKPYTRCAVRASYGLQTLADSHRTTHPRLSRPSSRKRPIYRFNPNWKHSAEWCPVFHAIKTTHLSR